MNTPPCNIRIFAQICDGSVMLFRFLPPHGTTIPGKGQESVLQFFPIYYVVKRCAGKRQVRMYSLPVEKDEYNRTISAIKH